jgi:hypothetical protein
MKSVIFWHVMRCDLVEINRSFEGMYCLHLQGGGIRKRGKEKEVKAVFSLYLKPEVVNSNFIRNLGEIRHTHRRISGIPHSQCCEELRSHPVCVHLPR